MALLEVDGIVAGYVAGIDILNGLRLRVEPGTITGIIGPNGAGKSTLLKTIFGFLHPRQGRIVFDGREIQRLSPHAIKRLGISYAPQGDEHPHLTVQENLQLGAWVLRRQGTRVAGCVERAYTAFPACAKAPPACYGPEWWRSENALHSQRTGHRSDPAPGGRTIGGARAADHPAGLCPTAAGPRSGVTILLVDQNISKAVEISDYLYMFEMGQVRHEEPRQVFTDQLR